MPLKITSWNLEWADKLLSGSKVGKEKDVDMDRRERIYAALTEMDPDILCMVEGPEGEERARRFSSEILHDAWVPVLLDGQGGTAAARNKKYATKGFQWIWFFVKPAIADRCRLQSPSVWQEATGCSEWNVHQWGDLYTVKPHEHYRHPQVLAYRFDDGTEMEVIGVHLKSAFMQTPYGLDANGNIKKEYLDEAITNRIKLATEARNVRAYISKRFDEGKETPPAMMIFGDCNDGESQDFFEENYLFFSVIANLQGNVLESEEYFYHGLFDFDPGQCWSIRFDDPVSKKKAKDNPLLLDHILYSLPLRNGPYPLHAKAKAGFVEHAVWEKYSPAKKAPVSDHRPVSITLT